MTAATVVIILVLVLAVLWFGQRKLIYFPEAGPVPSVAGAQDLTLHTADGLELGAWLFSAGRPITVLVANGNGGNRLGRLSLAQALVEKGFSVLLFDYRGYGGNAGSPSERGLALDVRAARAAVSGTVIYFGESLGSAVVTELATEIPPAALVLRSPFVDLASVGAAHYPFLPVRMLLREGFPTAERIARVKVPTVIVYGSGDSIVPPTQSRAVAQCAGGPVTVIEVPGADHNDRSLLDGPTLINAIVSVAAPGDHE
jgi:pimeloyl-ACP methyl ester carboxylesterase